MRIIKNGGHRLFEEDQETARVVSEMLRELERDGMDAVLGPSVTSVRSRFSPPKH
jgi:hypothetical protein